MVCISVVFLTPHCERYNICTCISMQIYSQFMPKWCVNTLTIFFSALQNKGYCQINSFFITHRHRMLEHCGIIALFVHFQNRNWDPLSLASWENRDVLVECQPMPFLFNTRLTARHGRWHGWWKTDWKKLTERCRHGIEKSFFC